MEKSKLQQVIAGFLVLATVAGVFAFLLNNNRSTNDDALRLTPEPSTYLKNAFVEDSNFDTILPRRNLTNELAARMADGMVGLNPDGPISLNGSYLAATPDLEWITEEFYNDPKNYGEMFVLAKQAEAPKIERGNLNISKSASLDAYQKNIAKIWQEQLGDPSFIRVLEEEINEEGARTAREVLAQANLDLAHTETPDQLADFHISMVKMLAYQEKILDLDSLLYGDPLRAAMLAEMQKKQMDELMADFRNEFSENKLSFINSADHFLLSDLFVTRAHAQWITFDPVQLAEAIWEHTQKTLTEIIKDRLVHRMVQQVITWVQGGGKPQFITNWKGFFKNVGNEAVGQVLDDIAPELCQSFGPLIRVNFLPVQGRNVTPVKCTLDRVVSNVENFYQSFNQGGWIAFGAVLEPQNNYFGSLITVNDELMKRKEEAEEAAKSEAEANSGYNSTKKCVKWEENTAMNAYNECMARGGSYFTCNLLMPNAAPGASGAGSTILRKCLEYENTTPGKTIADIVGQTMPAPMHRIVNAEDVTALLSALVNSALNRLIKSAVGGASEDEKNSGLANSSLAQPAPNGPGLPDPCSRLRGAQRTECQREACSELPTSIDGVPSSNLQTECQTSLQTGNANSACTDPYVEVDGYCILGGVGGAGGTGNSVNPPPALPSNLAGVVWEDRDVSGFAQTANLNASIGLNGSEVSVDLNYDRANTWPSQQMEGIEVVGNAWIFVYRNGAWHASTWEWLRPGQTQKDGSNLTETGSLRGELNNFQMQPGEIYYMMVSTPVRNNTSPTVQERSNVVRVQAPQIPSGGMSFTGASGSSGGTSRPSGGSTAGSPAISGAGPQFSFFGRNSFQVYVSYFDALRASDQTLDSDFAWLRSQGVGGIRIFPNWWRNGDYQNIPSDTLMDSEGNLRSDRLAKLRTVLSKAQQAGLTVDVSFAREVAGLNYENYRRGIVAATTELTSYRNVLFDLQNEVNSSWESMRLSNSQLQDLRGAVKSVDPNRLVAASVANEISPSASVSFTNANGFDFVAHHDSRSGAWYNMTDDVVSGLLSARRPVYLQEPAYMDPDDPSNNNPTNFLTAIRLARQSGAAAWVFHTENSFDLSSGSLQSRLSSAERQVLAGLRGVAQGEYKNGLSNLSLSNWSMRFNYAMSYN